MTEELTVLPVPNLSDVQLSLAVVQKKFETLLRNTSSDTAALRRQREDFAVDCIKLATEVVELGKFALWLNYKEGLWRGAIDAETGEAYANGMKYVTDFMQAHVENASRRSMFSTFAKYTALDQVGVSPEATVALVGAAPQMIGELIEQTFTVDAGGNFEGLAEHMRPRIEEHLEETVGLDGDEVRALSDSDLAAQFMESLAEMDRQEIAQTKRTILQNVSVLLRNLPAEKMLRFSFRRGDGKPTTVLFKMVETPENRANSKLPDIDLWFRKLIDGRYLKF